MVTQSIFELRKILKDGRPDAADYIATVPKRLQAGGAGAPVAGGVGAVRARGEGPEAEPPVEADARPRCGPFPAGP